MNSLTVKFVYPFSYLALLGKFLGWTIYRTWTERGRGNQLFREELVKQLYFTGVQVFFLVFFLALLVGSALGFGLSLLMRELGRPELMSYIFFVGIVRETPPLLTGLLVLGRTGSAVCTEFATNVYNRELEIFRVQGIDVYKILILPRLLGVTFAVFAMSVLFAAISCLSGVFVLNLSTGIGFSTLLLNVLNQGSPYGLFLFVFQAVAAGLVISVICALHGLRVERDATAIPRAVSSAMVHSLVALFFVSILRFLLSF